MGNTCCADNKDSQDGPAKIPAQVKEIKVHEIDTEPEKFGQKVNEAFFKLSDPVKDAIRKYNLYKFDQSAPELKGFESLPVKRASNEDFHYEGNFMGQKLQGKGHMLTKEGDFFVCTFFDGLAKGMGAVYFANGNYFFGRLNRGDLDEGKMIYADGTIYVGGFRAGKRHGRGSYEYKDKSKYEGAWQNDVEHGIGRLIYDGVWENGKRKVGANPVPEVPAQDLKPSEKKEPVKEAPIVDPKAQKPDQPPQTAADQDKRSPPANNNPPAPEPIKA